MSDKDRIEKAARALCPYKASPCPGKACKVCADKARAVLAILTAEKS